MFLRDKSAVFFSLLSMLIVLMLMGVFLGSMNVETITGLLAEYGGFRDTVQDQANAQQLVQYWTLAGLMVVNAVTVTMTVMGIIVEDANENRLASFYCAPVSKGLLAVSYIAAGIIIGTAFCLLTLAVSLIYIQATGGEMLSFAALIKIFMYTLINTGIFAIIMYLATLFVRSSSAWSGIGTVVGTLVGFIGAIYLPMGSLPAGVANVLKYIPILHGTSLMRKICCEEVLNKTFSGLSPEVSAGYREHMGIDVILGDHLIGNNAQIIFLISCGLVALAAVIVVAGKKKYSQ